MDQVRPDLRNMQSSRSMDWIHFNHPNPGKKIPDIYYYTKRKKILLLMTYI